MLWLKLFNILKEKGDWEPAVVAGKNSLRTPDLKTLPVSSVCTEDHKMSSHSPISSSALCSAMFLPAQGVNNVCFQAATSQGLSRAEAAQLVLVLREDQSEKTHHPKWCTCVFVSRAVPIFRLWKQTVLFCSVNISFQAQSANLRVFTEGKHSVTFVVCLEQMG